MWISINKEKFYDIGDTLDSFVDKNKVSRLRAISIVGYIQSDIQELECEVTDCVEMHKATFKMFTNENGYVRVMVEGVKF